MSHNENLLLEQLYDELIDNIHKYHPAADNNEAIRKAYEYAKTAHDGQYRKSGEPFVIHPLKVAIILSKLKLDKESIIAAILHDVVEDTCMNSKDIENEFGEEVMFLVEGVTKISMVSGSLSKKEMKMESFRKLVLATAQDIRVIIIKLADRLHNMQTLQYQSEKKQLEISSETMEIYSPIAQRLGISILNIELEDLAFSYLFPMEFKEISREVNNMKQHKLYGSIRDNILEVLEDNRIHCSVRYEIKHLFSIYRKMISREKTIDEIYDTAAIKITVNSVKDCYVVLGVLHNMFTPVLSRIKDYIAIPKENMYQSLHTTLISKEGRKFEVQIKTQNMDTIAQYGVLAYWKYGESDAKKISRSQREKSIWLKQILEWQQDISDNSEFIDLVKHDFDLFSKSILCFTPKGDVKRIQKGATIIDFAYSIHSDIGNQAVGAFVNGKRRDVNYILHSGDLVEVITSDHTNGPSIDWLSFVKTSNAKNKIKKWYRNTYPSNMDSKDSNELNLNYKLARCCMPIKGDDIVGVVTNKRGIIVHCSNCKKLYNINQKNKIFNISWENIAKKEYLTTLFISLHKDSSFKEFENICSNLCLFDVSIVELHYIKKRRFIKAVVCVENKESLDIVIRKLEQTGYFEKIERGNES